MKQCKSGWIIPAIIIIVNACAIWISWSGLPQVLPAHFDPAGNASGSMERTTLLFYPVISMVLCLAIYGGYALADRILRFKPDVKGLRLCGLHVMASCLALTIMSSTMVTLTFGTSPLFMFAEPVILLAGIVTLVVCFIKASR